MAGLIDPDFARLPEPASSLFLAAAGRSFFNHPRWYEVLARSILEPGARARLYIANGAGVRVGLVAAAPRTGSGRLRSLTNYYSCEHALLRGNSPGDPPGDPTAAIGELVGQIAVERPRWDALAISTLDPQDACYAILAAAMRDAGFDVEAYFEFGTWYEETAGLSFAEYLAQRPSAVLATWRRKLKQAKESGNLDFRVHSDLADIESAIASYETVYRASWKQAEPYPRFIPDLVRAGAALGAVRLGILYLDGKPVAAQIWILWHGRATVFKLAHDQRHDDLSPGTLLTMRMMEQALEIERPSEINFGRGDDAYKKLWASKRRERWGLVAANPRTVHGLALTAGQLARRMLRSPRQPPLPPEG